MAVVHAQRADRYCNVQIWGVVGAQQEVVYAAKHAIVTVEEIIDDDIVRSDPNRTVIPAHAVDAVVHCPGGAHPSYVQGHYDRDNAFYRDWTPISRDPQRLHAWLAEWVHGVQDRESYLEKLGGDSWKDDVAVGERLSGQVD